MGNSSPMALAEQPKVALITGITGQDGSYLAELLLEKGYMVHGIIRRSSSFNTGRIEHLFKELAFKEAGFTITWHGEKGTVDEVGKDQEGKVRVKIDPQYFRPTEVDLLLGDPAKAEKALGWKRKVSFQELVEEMVRKDIEFVAQNVYHI